jgi:hypothetical protein
VGLLIAYVTIPHRYPKTAITQWIEEGIAEYLERTEDVRKFLEKADCIVLPSYRKGTPRSLLESHHYNRYPWLRDCCGR